MAGGKQGLEETCRPLAAYLEGKDILHINLFFVDRTLNKSRFNFIPVKEPVAEKKLGIKLEESIRLSKMKPLLSGDNISLSSPSTFL